MYKKMLTTRKIGQVILFGLLGVTFVLPIHFGATAFSCSKPKAVISLQNQTVNILEKVFFSAADSAVEDDTDSTLDSRFKSKSRSKSKRFDDSSLEYSWSIDQLGIKQSGEVFEFVPQTPGEYEIKLTVSNNCGSDTVSTILTVIEEPAPEPVVQKPDFVVESIEYKETWMGSRHLVAARVCNQGNVLFSPYNLPSGNMTTQFDLNGIRVPALTGAIWRVGECHVLAVPLYLFGLDYQQDTGEYEVKVAADTYENNSFHNNVADELNENNNTKIETLFLGLKPGQEDIVGHIFGDQNAPVTMQIFYDFDLSLLNMVEPMENIMDKYQDQVNLHLVYTTQTEPTDLRRKAAAVVACVADQGNNYLLHMTEVIKNGSLPNGFNLDAFIDFVTQNIDDGYFMDDDFRFCSGTLRQQFINEQIEYASSLGVNNPGVIRLINNSTGESQQFATADFDDLEASLKAYLGINDSSNRFLHNKTDRITRQSKFSK